MLTRLCWYVQYYWQEWQHSVSSSKAAIANGRRDHSQKPTEQRYKQFSWVSKHREVKQRWRQWRRETRLADRWPCCTCCDHYSKTLDTHRSRWRIDYCSWQNSRGRPHLATDPPLSHVSNTDNVRTSFMCKPFHYIVSHHNIAMLWVKTKCFYAHIVIQEM